MSELLPNYLQGQWQTGASDGTALFDPVLGDELVRVDAGGLDLAAGFEFARDRGGAALRALTYRERGALIRAIIEVLQGNRADYYAIATANSGTVQADSGIDIQGATMALSTYAELGEALGDAHYLRDGDAAHLGANPLFQSQHIQVPAEGLALFINAFNFPAWGLWEKAGPALLSGVPMIVKPATATAWLTQRMVKDVIDAGVLPVGALSIICGSSRGLQDALQPFDVLAFTGSADTAAKIRAHPAVALHSVRTNIEADSVNAAILLPGETPNGEALGLLARSVVNEMTAKSGQKCTAIRRIFVPEAMYDAAADAIADHLAKITVGNPRNDNVRMGSLVSREQFDNVNEGLAKLSTAATVLHDGRKAPLVDADPAVAACASPVLFGTKDADGAALVHNTEVFGPAATLLPYRTLDHALMLARRGQGSLAASLYGNDMVALAAAARGLAGSHGRVHVVSPDVAQLHTGHGNVMPQSLHGGPGRAGGGEELGGHRALGFYHRRAAVQASTAVLGKLPR